MGYCAYCQAESEMYENGVPLCIRCADEHPIHFSSQTSLLADSECESPLPFGIEKGNHKPENTSGAAACTTPRPKERDEETALY